MAKTIVALYRSLGDARTAAEELVANGFERNDISLVANAGEEEVQRHFDEEGRYKGAEREYPQAGTDDGVGEGAAAGAGVGAAVGGVGGLLVGLGLLTIPGVGPALAAGPLGSTLVGAGVGGAAGGLLGALTDAGVPEEDAHHYAEGVRRGGSLLMVRTSDNRADEAATVMGRHGSVDIESQASNWRRQGWERHDQEARPLTRDQLATEREEMSIPVVEEDVKVGKREVERGGVHARTYVKEQPVDEQVDLRDEEVNVERRPANRRASEDDFQSREVEMTETDEVPVVEKEARVIEDVVLEKHASQREETVHDTARRTEVEVDDEPVDEDFSRYERTFRGHFRDSQLSDRYEYDDVVPAYRYGWSLANTERFRGRDWEEVEPEARRAWEERNAGTWDDVREPVRRSWQEARSKK